MHMTNPRTYGAAPFEIAVVHGGPGAPGEMAPVAAYLSRTWGVIEPLQTANSVAGQIEELARLMRDHARVPVVLIGFSWGAWLSLMCTAHHPALIKKLILIASAPFEKQYAATLLKTRMNRLSEKDRLEAHTLMKAMGDPTVRDKGRCFELLARLITIADIKDPLMRQSDALAYQYDIFERVWPEADEMRSAGTLIELAQRIVCPVVAIHGDYDPHPIDGVKEPLGRVIKDFRCIPLKDCGHYPWRERAARDAFFTALTQELMSS